MVISIRAAVAVCAGALLLTAAGSAPGDDVAQTAVPLDWQDPAPAIAHQPVIPTEFPGVATPADLAALEVPAALTTATETPASAKVPPLIESGPAPSQEVLDRMSDEEMHCLSVAVYHEARGEPRDGQLAVAQVVLNRAKSGKFPKSVCGVVLQPAQFSSIRANWQPRESATWRSAREVAEQAAEGERLEQLGNALYFHATHVSPGWRKQRVATIGNHVFYR